jgi:hypothetical protein
MKAPLYAIKSLDVSGEKRQLSQETKLLEDASNR